MNIYMNYMYMNIYRVDSTNQLSGLGLLSPLKNKSFHLPISAFSILIHIFQ